MAPARIWCLLEPWHISTITTRNLHSTWHPFSTSDWSISALVFAHMWAHSPVSGPRGSRAATEQHRPGWRSAREGAASSSPAPSCRQEKLSEVAAKLSTRLSNLLIKEMTSLEARRCSMDVIFIKSTLWGQAGHTYPKALGMGCDPLCEPFTQKRNAQILTKLIVRCQKWHYSQSGMLFCYRVSSLSGLYLPSSN